MVTNIGSGSYSININETRSFTTPFSSFLNNSLWEVLYIFVDLTPPTLSTLAHNTHVKYAHGGQA